MNESSMDQKNRVKRTVYFLAPFFSLLLIIIVINFISWQQRKQSATSALETAVSIPTAAVKTAVMTQPSLTLTPKAAPIPPAPTLHPTYSHNAAIVLIGPPQNSMYLPNETITFYWEWDDLLYEGDYFALFFHINDQERFIGTIFEPNLGTRYRLSIYPESLNDLQGEVQWSVHLKNDLEPESLFTSDIRTITFLQTEN